jgi:thiol-disulfide isomerase/thioredoxin
VTGVLVLVVTLAGASALGLLMRARNGRMRPVAAPTGSEPQAAPGIDLAAVGARLGERATLLQFSSAFCAPCRATRALLDGVAEIVPGVQHVEVDVADSDAALELVRRLDIRRTPTTLVLDAAGREVRRASGVPRREQVLAALGDAVDGEAASEAGSRGGSDAGSATPGHVR